MCYNGKRGKEGIEEERKREGIFMKNEEDARRAMRAMQKCGEKMVLLGKRKSSTRG